MEGLQHQRHSGGAVGILVLIMCDILSVYLLWFDSFPSCKIPLLSFCCDSQFCLFKRSVSCFDSCVLLFDLLSHGWLTSLSLCDSE